MSLALAGRRLTVFALLFGTGVFVLARVSGGVWLDVAARDGSSPLTNHGAHTQLPETGGITVGKGAALGPGRGGRLDRDDVTIVREKPLTWREMTAEWAATAPEASNEPGVTLQRLADARLVFFPRPSDEAPAVVTKDDAPGVTVMTGREALLRRRENGPASVHAEGDCVVTQVLEGGEGMVLRSDLLDFRTEERGKGRAPVRIVETDRAVRIEGGGSQLSGTGLLAELEAGPEGRTGDPPRTPPRGASRRVARILKDVQGLLHGRAPKKAGAKAPEIHVACDGTADIETLDRPGRDGRQPWRTTFRENVRFVETASTMTAERVVVDFVRPGAADLAAGAEKTDVRGLTATGSVRIDGRDPTSAYHAEGERLRRFAEDLVTDVTVLEGAPVLTWQGRPQNADPSATPSAYEVRCTGPVTIRERRVAADRDAEAAVTFTFQGDVVATECVVGTQDVRSRTTAPLMTIECRRNATGRLDPRVMRAEQGAQAQYRQFAARAQTITAVTGEPGAMQHVALVGSPVATWNLAAGASPLGGRDEEPGTLVLSSDQRIDADIAPDPPPGQKPSGTRVATKVQGGMVARRMTGDRESWRLVARDGDAKIHWDGGIEEMHAVGAAHLVGAAQKDGTSGGDLTGERITVTRPAAAPAQPGAKPEDASRLDVVVEGTPEAPAKALLGRDQVVARTLVQSDRGTVLDARGGARAKLDRSETGQGIDAEADEMRVDVDVDESGARSPRSVVATGRVVLGDKFHRVTGDRVTYHLARGEAEATGAPARIERSGGGVAYDAARPEDRSRAAGPVVRAWFDPDEKKSAGDRFLRANLPQGGDIVAFEEKPDRSDRGGGADEGIVTRERVTTTCRGPLDLTRTTASCVRDVVCLHESRAVPGDTWTMDSRIDCARLDLTFDPTAAGAGASSKIRTFVAQGTPDTPAQIHTKSPTGVREAFALAERIDGRQDSTTMDLTCPSDRTSVHLHDVTAGRHMRGDSVTFNYRTFEWTNWVRMQYVE